MKNKSNKRLKKRHSRATFIISISLGILAILTLVIFINDRESQGEEIENINVEFTTHVFDNSSLKENQLISGKETLLTFILKDNKTGKPITGLEPEIKFLSSGGSEIGHRHGLDPNQVNLAKLQLLVLNSKKGTIEVLDAFGNYDPRPLPIKSMGTVSSKMISLKREEDSIVGDIVTGRYGDYVYATLSGENQVAVVNTISHEVIKYIDVGNIPELMFLQPDSKFLWVSNDGGGNEGGSVSIIDTNNNTLVKTIPTGKGHHQVAFSPENAWVTNSQTNTVSVIRLEDLQKIKDIKMERAPYGIIYSHLTKKVYVTNIIAGSITIIDANDDANKEGFIPLGRGIEKISLSPDQNRAVVLNKYINTAFILDLENKSIIKKVKTGESPDAIVFLDEYALIRNANSPDVTYVSMKNPDAINYARVGNIPPINITSNSIKTISYGDETVVTSPREGRVYFMHKMYGQPMVMSSVMVGFGGDSVIIVENKLHETSPGNYQQYIIHNREGLYTIKFESQKINASFDIEVLPDESGDIKIISLFNKTFEPGIYKNITYQILDKETGLYIENADITFIVAKSVLSNKGTWSKRLTPKYIGDGIYEAGIIFPEEGDYIIALTSSVLSNRGQEDLYDYVVVKE